MPLRKLADLPAAAEPDDFERLLARIDASVAVIAGWDEARQRRVHELREAIETLHAEALRRLVRGLREVPEAEAQLRGLLGDEVIYAVMRRLGVLRPSLHERIEDALQAVRPQLALGGGDVELCRVVTPDAVQLRWRGACNGDTPVARSLQAKVRQALQAACPEITQLVAGSGAPEAEVTHER